MCVNIEVILPTVKRFLLFYPLRCGSSFIMLWTSLRTIFCLLFTSTAILEALIGVESPIGRVFVKEKPETEHLYVVYYVLLLLLSCEALLLVFMIHLTMGLYYIKPYLLEHYLVCRFITWLVEISSLVILCFLHKILIGWYLGILFFVVLEFYSFIVVYSYYANIEEEKEFVKRSF